MRKSLLLLSIGAALLVGVASAANGTVNIAMSENVITLNPADTNDNLDFSLERPIYEGLVGFDKDGKLVPELATSWTASPDATEFTFDLRKGVTFQDGTPFNAQAVKTYFDWVIDPTNHFKRESLYNVIKSIDAVSEYQVKFTLSEPFGAMLYTFAHPAGRIVSPAAIQKYGKDVATHPVGTGPFTFVSSTPGQKVVLKANPSYWGDAPKVANIDFLFVPNAATRVAMLQSGEAQFIQDLPPQLVDPIKSASNLQVSATPSIYVRYMAMNTQVKPFDDQRVRQALNYAVDKKTIVDVIAKGYGSELTAPIAEQVTGYAKQQTYGYDPEKARQLLAEAGYPNGFTFTIDSLNNTTYQQIDQVLQQMFAKVGVTAKINAMESGTFSSTAFAPFDKTTLQAVVIGWSPSTGDADWGLRPLFAKASWPPDLYNLAFYDNANVNKLIQDGLSTANQDIRDRAYAAAQKTIWNDAPWVFLYSPYNIAGVAKNVSGVFYMPDGTVDARAAALQ
ncbi:MAG TPA: glutathione ABC transporter substrate-binding protein [Trueperaceae bacterium]|nr:glutathione ABC transporter substrate-binding protein [Trueperaceae bacterium]